MIIFAFEVFTAIIFHNEADINTVLAHVLVINEHFAREDRTIDSNFRFEWLYMSAPIVGLAARFLDCAISIISRV